MLVEGEEGQQRVGVRKRESTNSSTKKGTGTHFASEKRFPLHPTQVTGWT